MTAIEGSDPAGKSVMLACAEGKMSTCYPYLARTTRLTILLMLTCVVAGFCIAAKREKPAPKEEGWTILFRSDDPMIWHQSSGSVADENGFSVTPAKAPANTKFVRIRRMDTGDGAIIRISRDDVGKTGLVDGPYFWTGDSKVRGPDGKKNLLLGIADKDWAARGKSLVTRMPGTTDRGYRGWGFSKAASADQTQTYSWAGEEIKKTVFEIAVKSAELTELERTQLLTKAAEANVASPPSEREKSAKAKPPEGPDDADATKIGRTQSSIKGLYVIDREDGLMLGNTMDIILTATPGKPRDKFIPVTFATRVGGDMHLVLEDVLRAINVKYPRVAVEKVELSFEDKYTAKDGGSIGAAVGTLLLSMIQGFQIDPTLAITGDVTADSKIRRIGGVAAKLRGAGATGCTTVAIPADNYDQLADILVYEGPAAICNVQVLGVATLDDAAAVARVDKDANLSQALDLFAAVQFAMKKSPAAFKTKENQDTLAKVIELAPYHLSAKLLLLAAQDKQPKRLTALATLYFTQAAIRTISPTLAARARNIGTPQVAPSVVKDGLHTLDRIHRIADPGALPLVDAWTQYLRALSDVESAGASPKILQPRWDAVQDAAAKFDANRDLQEKLLREGI